MLPRIVMGRSGRFCDADLTPCICEWMPSLRIDFRRRWVMPYLSGPSDDLFAKSDYLSLNVRAQG